MELSDNDILKKNQEIKKLHLLHKDEDAIVIISYKSAIF